MPETTISEKYFEEWCCLNQIKFQRIKEARVEGYKRPDFAIKVGEHWCVVEVKQLEPNPPDKHQLETASEKREAVSVFWKKSPGSRLIRGLREAKSQLRKFSIRNLPTVVCFFDNTLGFYDEPRDVKQAMRRVKTDTISAIAVLRKPATDWVVDLFHYPEPRVRILPDCAGLLVRKNITPADEERAIRTSMC
jgi:hypothetical protein